MEPDHAAEMRLPADKHCDDCAHSKRCFGFGFSAPGRTSCDFWPSRYREQTLAGSGEAIAAGQLRADL